MTMKGRSCFDIEKKTSMACFKYSENVNKINDKRENNKTKSSNVRYR